MPKGRARAAPKTTSAKRLEDVRTRSGFETLTDFHKALAAEGVDVTYGTARLYHTTNESASVDYYIGVHKLTDADLGWLVGGVGDGPFPQDRKPQPMSEWAEGVTARAMHESARINAFRKLLPEGTPDWTASSLYWGARQAFDLVGRTLIADARRSGVEEPNDDAMELEFERRLVRVALDQQPILTDLRVPQWYRFCRNFAFAIEALVPRPEELSSPIGDLPPWEMKEGGDA